MLEAMGVSVRSFKLTGWPAYLTVVLYHSDTPILRILPRQTGCGHPCGVDECSVAAVMPRQGALQTQNSSLLCRHEHCGTAIDVKAESETQDLR